MRSFRFAQLVCLEERVTPTIRLTNGTLLLAGSLHFGNVIQVRTLPDQQILVAQVNGTGAQFALSTVHTLNIRGGPYFDVIAVDDSVSIPAIVRAGSGWDHVQGGSGNDTIWGGYGNDTLSGGAGNDTLWGDGRNDVLSGGPGQDFLNGGRNGLRYTTATGWFWSRDTIFANAEDTIVPEAHPYIPDVILEDVGGDGGTGSGQQTNVVLDWSLVGSLTVVSANSLCVLYTSGVEITYTGVLTLKITGTSGDDYIDVSGFCGRTTIIGGSGDDTLIGGCGNDSILGGDGDDWIDGGEGNDTLIGNAGDDTITGGDGNDRIDLRDGSPRDYVLDAEAGDTVLRDPVPGGVITAFDDEPDDQTGVALYRGETVRLEQIFYPGVNGIFYRLWLNGVLQQPSERRANGHITVEVPATSAATFDGTLRSDLEQNGWLTIVVIQRTSENTEPADPRLG